MKMEISIEEKAKRYDEALKVLHKYDGANIMFTQDLKEEIFPELKESEDEKIRKSLIDWFSDKHAADDFRGIAWERIVAWLEKQGEQNLIMAKSPQLGEHKPANKAEPKFKVGEWLVHKDLVSITCCITQIHAPHYYLTNNNSFIMFGKENNYRPWTIQDAKAGDVLCCESGWTCIFKTLVNDETFSSYCFMDNTKWFCETGSECHTLNERFAKAYNGEIHPATKERRDTLMKAMADAGYTFDFDKKELRKIEQKSSEKYNITGIGSKNAQGKLKEMLDKKEKPAWSDEDSPYYDDICEILINLLRSETANVNKDAVQNDLDWLNSLKDRVQPQLKQEWSEEDYNEIEIIACHLDNIDNEGMAEILRNIRDKYYHIIPQTQWKPSDEHYELEEFAKIVRSNLTGISKAVQELFEAKYLQLTGNKMYQGFKD